MLPNFTSCATLVDLIYICFFLQVSHALEKERSNGAEKAGLHSTRDASQLSAMKKTLTMPHPPREGVRKTRQLTDTTEPPATPAGRWRQTAPRAVSSPLHVLYGGQPFKGFLLLMYKFPAQF